MPAVTIIQIVLIALGLTVITYGWAYPWLAPLPLIWGAWMIWRRLAGYTAD